MIWGASRVIRHIEFCLQEIECEIEAGSGTGLSKSGREGLQNKIAGMRALLAVWQLNATAMAAGDRLTMIRGIDGDTAAHLAARGITRFDTIANWRRADILALVDGTLSFERIAEQNWIEQAAVLVEGNLTHFARSTEIARIVSLDALAPAVADTAIARLTAAGELDAQSQPEAINDMTDVQVAALAAALAQAAETSPSAETSIEKAPSLGSSRPPAIKLRLAQTAAILIVLAAASPLNGWSSTAYSAIEQNVAVNAQLP